jgi:hypothetical protein
MDLHTCSYVVNQIEKSRNDAILDGISGSHHQLDGAQQQGQEALFFLYYLFIYNSLYMHM